LGSHEILFLVFSYLIGAIPFGFILYFLWEKKDIRSEGSGNIGAANVMRSKGRCAGIITLILDMMKAMIPIFYGLNRFDSPVIAACGGAAVVIGHLFPIYLKFKGGKGIASFVGILAVFHFPSALVFASAFLVTLFFTRYVSLSSMTGLTAAFLVILFTQVVEISMVFFLIWILILYRHKSNINRLMEGREPAFTCNKKIDNIYGSKYDNTNE